MKAAVDIRRDPLENDPTRREARASYPIIDLRSHFLRALSEIGIESPPSKAGTGLDGGTLLKEVDRLFKPFGPFGPHIGASEFGTRYVVAVEFPGIDPSEIDVRLLEDNLTISGNQNRNWSVTKTHDRSGAFNSHLFARSFKVPDDVVRDEIAAVLENGVLEVNLPKKR